jgi:hypothetical protein
MFIDLTYRGYWIALLLLVQLVLLNITCQHQNKNNKLVRNLMIHTKKLLLGVKFIQLKRYGKNIKKPSKLPTVYNITLQCLKSNKVSSQTMKM